MEFEVLLSRTLENPRVPQRILENSRETKKASQNPHRIGKVNSVSEASAKCFAVHILKFEILQIT